MKKIVLVLFVLLCPFGACAEDELCAAVHCPRGKVCFNGQCYNDCRLSGRACPVEGETCQTRTGVCGKGCSVNADCTEGYVCKNEECVKLCDKNVTVDGTVCEGETPECYENADGSGAYCGCLDNSCGAGNVCSGTKCTPCPRGYVDFEGFSCHCPAGYASDGAGGCGICGAGQNCSCPPDTVTNGKGMCVRCLTADDCGESGKACLNAGTFDAACADLECPDGTYMQKNSCLACMTGCAACENGEACLKCAETFYMDGVKCKSCEERFGKGCGVCKADGKQCEECQIGYTKQSDGSCLPVLCEAGLYLDGDECMECSAVLPHCAQCSDDKTCAVCRGKGRVVKDGMCVCSPGWEENGDSDDCVQIKCSEGFFNNGTGCIGCGDFLTGCLACSAADKCDVCNEFLGYFRNEQGVCERISCGQGTYRDKTACLPCANAIENCLNCSENGRECSACKTGTLLSEDKTQCVPIQCADDEYLDGNDCFSCSKFENCAACNKDSCIRCGKLFNLRDGKCIVKICREDEALNKETGICEKCGEGQVPSENGCIPKICPKGQFLQGNDCLPCAKHCLRCADASSCRVCDIGYGMVNGTGACERCPVGTFLKGTQCLPCSQTMPYCKECAADGSVCLECEEKARLTVLRRCAL